MRRKSAPSLRRFAMLSGLWKRKRSCYGAPSRRGAPRRGGRAVECTALEMRHACKGIGGSNPPLSASQLQQVVVFIALKRSTWSHAPTFTPTRDVDRSERWRTLLAARQARRRRPVAVDELLGGCMSGAWERIGNLRFWHAKLLDDPPPEKRSPPFNKVDHTFGSLQAVVDWQGYAEVACSTRAA